MSVSTKLSDAITQYRLQTGKEPAELTISANDLKQLKKERRSVRFGNNIVFEGVKLRIRNP